MKKRYPFINAMLVIAFAVFSNSSYAQAVDYLNANNVNAGIGVGGNLFSVLDSNQMVYSLLEFPKGSNKRTTCTTSLWFSATDAAQNLHCAGQSYANGVRDFYDGPIAANYTAAYNEYYKRVFKVTRSQITRHVSLGSNINPNQIDSAILFWPAKGNHFVSSEYGVTIDSKLAPFIDADGDQVYNPSHGDVPAICGEEAIFFVFNDDRGPHEETKGAKLGVEIRGLAEVFTDYSFHGFDDPYPPKKRAINSTVFVNYEIENKSTNQYTDFYVGLYDDVDLGCYDNDRIGCDTNRNLMFTYNGVYPEPDCNGVAGYGNQNVASAVKTLNRKLSAFNYALGGTLTPDSQGVACTNLKNVLSGLWVDGRPLMFDSIPTKYLYPGDPNDTSDWTDFTTGYPSGDRRTITSIGPVALAPGETKNFDYAFIASLDSTGTNLTIVDTLKRDADLIQAFYDNTILPCRLNSILSSDIKRPDNTLHLSVHPNPSSSVLIVESETKIDLLEITDLMGRTVLTKTADASKVTIDVSGLAKGLYLLKVKSDNNYGQLKIVRE